MKDLVSVIVPVHNSGKYVEKCIDSLINQSYENIEIIVILNGSTDDSLDKLKKYKDRINIINLEKANLGLARNKGIEVSKGKYVSFVDSDDEVDKCFIEELVKSISNSDMSICNIKEIYEEDEKEVIRNEYPYNEINNKEDVLDNLEKFNYGPCNKLYKRELIVENNIKFLEGMKYEDLPFVLNYICKLESISKVNKELYNYKIHKNSEQTVVNERVFDIIFSLNECKKYVNKDLLENLYVRIITTYILKMRCVNNKKLRKEFIEFSYNELDKNYKDWKNCKYIKSLKRVKKIVVCNKKILSGYCKIYSILSGRK